MLSLQTPQTAMLLLWKPRKKYIQLSIQWNYKGSLMFGGHVERESLEDFKEDPARACKIPDYTNKTTSTWCSCWRSKDTAAFRISALLGNYNSCLLWNCMCLGRPSKGWLGLGSCIRHSEWHGHSTKTMTTRVVILFSLLLAIYILELLRGDRCPFFPPLHLSPCSRDTLCTSLHSSH